MSSELVLADTASETVLASAASKTALSLPDGLDWEKWETIGSTLGSMNRASAWWIGDWVNYGERSYGEKYAQALEVTGLEYKSLAQYAWVAREVSSRLEDLSFAHHQEVATLEPDQQAEWLSRAREGKWSKAQLRAAIKEARSTNGAAPVAEAPEGEAEPGSEEYRSHTSNVVKGVWANLNSVELVGTGLAEVDAELIAQNTTSEEVVQMIEMLETALTGLRTFQGRLEEHMQR